MSFKITIEDMDKGSGDPTRIVYTQIIDNLNVQTIIGIVNNPDAKLATQWEIQTRSGKFESGRG